MAGDALSWFAIDYADGPHHLICRKGANDMNVSWLLRMSLWARNPPSAARVKFVFGIVAICLVLFGIEKLFGWPDWMTPNRLRP